MMTVINAFSKFAFAIPLKTKTGVEAARAFKLILTENKIEYSQTDNGKKYYNTVVQSLLKRYGVKHYSTYSEKKAPIVEISMERCKTRIYCAFSKQYNYCWLILLLKLVKASNDTVHRTVGIKPRKVKERTVMKRKIIKVRKNKLNVGDRVRISKYKMTFAKSYTQN